MTVGGAPETPREVVLRLCADAETRAELATDPAGALARRGLDGFSRDEAIELVGAVGDSVPTEAVLVLDGFGSAGWDAATPFPSLADDFDGSADGLLGLDAFDEPTVVNFDDDELGDDAADLSADGPDLNGIESDGSPLDTDIGLDDRGLHDQGIGVSESSIDHEVDPADDLDDLDGW